MPSMINYSHAHMRRRLLAGAMARSERSRRTPRDDGPVGPLAVRYTCEEGGIARNYHRPNGSIGDRSVIQVRRVLLPVILRTHVVEVGVGTSGSHR